ncbi:50S ribosomal protein L1 [Poronia punctata]|nr:50S ribosomal protein L1 [Poronia punctata]
MATPTQCIAMLARNMARVNLSSMTRPAIASIPKLAPPSITQQVRWKSGMAQQARAKEKAKLKAKKRKSRHKEYKFAAPSTEEQFSLCDAMRYLRAAEVGRPPSAATYEVSLRFRTIKNSPVLRARLRLPYPIKNDTRIGVICPEGSGVMNEARNAGAVAFGEESIFEMIRENPNKLPFNRLICHVDSEPALKAAKLGRILGPKGLMPSIKTNTITKSIVPLMHEMAGALNYREKIGCIRLPIGNIQFTPRQLSENIKSFMTSVRGRMQLMEDRVSKEIVEVVLSSTSGPGFPLSGAFLSTDESITPAHLSTAM